VVGCGSFIAKSMMPMRKIRPFLQETPTIL